MNEKQMTILLFQFLDKWTKENSWNDYIATRDESEFGCIKNEIYIKPNHNTACETKNPIFTITVHKN